MLTEKVGNFITVAIPTLKPYINNEVDIMYEVYLNGNLIPYEIIKIEGLEPVTANIVTSYQAQDNVPFFESVELAEREIVITIHPGDMSNAKTVINRWFDITKDVEVKLWSDIWQQYVYAYGTLAEIEWEVDKKNGNGIIRILCPDSIFYSAMKDGTTSISDFFVHPVGFRVELQISNSKSYVNINVNSGGRKSYRINYNFQAGDKLIYDTRIGHHECVVIRNDVVTNIYCDTWLQLNFNSAKLTSPLITHNITISPIVTSDVRKIYYKAEWEMV